MGTSYSEIYKMNNVIKSDRRLSKLDDCELNSIRFSYLKFAISYFLYDCRKDLNNRQDPVYSSYEYTGDGVTKEFILSPEPEINSNFVVYIINSDGKNIVKDFSYNEVDNTIIFENAPLESDGVLIKSYTVGEFFEELDIREINILAEGMNVPYIEEAKNDENVMKYIISGSSLRFFSQANHMNSINLMVENQKYHMLDSLISEYTYKGSPDNYKGLSGRGSG